MHKTILRLLTLADIFQSVCVCGRGITAEMLPKLREPALCVVCVREGDVMCVQCLAQNLILLGGGGWLYHRPAYKRRSNIGCMVFDCVNHTSDFEEPYFLTPTCFQH